MFIVFIIVLITILVGIMSAIYSVFAPFMQNIGNVVFFNSAYYGALGAIERGQLVLKYKQPGFEGSGGFLQGEYFGPESDKLDNDFGLLTSQNNGFLWKISSRTNTIPKPGEGNIDYLLSYGTDSINYNKLPYFTSERIFLEYDDTTDPYFYYTGTSNINYFNGGYFSGIIRVSPKAKESFANSPLCFNKDIPICDSNNDWIYDDMIVNWIFEGNYDGTPFSIIPTISIFYYSGGFVQENEDIAIRESIINETGSLYFGDMSKKYSLLANRPNILTQHNVVSLDEDTIKTIGFNNLLSSSATTTGLNLGMGIVNLIYTENGNIHPFLEYQFSFPQPIADKFFTLEGIGMVGDYNVKIFIKKSTDKKGGGSIGDFTVIF